MKLISKIGGWGKKAVNQAVGVTSGEVPVPILDSSKAFSLVVIIGLLAFGISGWLVWNSIFSATKVKPVAQSNVNAIAEINKLRLQDTDSDGISNYDELYALKTSPYLADSDSDGINDNTELNQDTDPNCPKGSSCNGVAPNSPATDASGQLTPDFLRQALLSSGVPQSTVQQLNDADLLRVYQDATNTAVANDNSGNATVPTLNNLQNLSADEIRKLMVDSGMNATDLASVDDATIKQIFEEALKQGTSN